MDSLGAGFLFAGYGRHSGAESSRSRGNTSSCRIASRDPFGNTAFTAYDPYDLLLVQTTDPIGNRTSAEHDYRLLQPFRMTDQNGNRAEVAFDTLGLVVGDRRNGKTHRDDMAIPCRDSLPI